jgi:hypothetical protein
MTLASSIFTEFYDDATPNTTLSSILKDLDFSPPLACTNIGLTSHGVWYRFSTKDLSGLSSTSYNLTAHASSPENFYVLLAVFKGDSCPVPLYPSTLESFNRTKSYSDGSYGNRYNSFVDNIFPYSCVADSLKTGFSTFIFPVETHGTYFIYLGRSSFDSGNVTLSLTVRTLN